MKLLKSSPETAALELRALAMVARTGHSGLDQPQRAILEAVQRIVLQTDLDIETSAPLTAEELVDHMGDAKRARQLIRLMVAISLADGPPSKEQMSLISTFSKALNVREPSVGVIRHLARNRRLLFRLAFFRHSHLRNYFRNTYRMTGGLRQTIKAIFIFRGVAEDSNTARQFRSLEHLPEHTLGHQFFKHCVEEGIGFPGEKGGFPIGAVYHDFTHVLAGYDTTPEGEMKAAAFQAGFTQDDDDFFTALFAIVIHTAGINLAPFPMPVLPGRIGQGNLALEVFHALERGSAVNVDLGNEWDFWKYVELPIEIVREKLGVPPINADLLCA